MKFGAYVFDAYGTLFDVHAAVRRHAETIGPDSQRLSEIWRVKQLEYTWVRTLAGRYADFWAVTEAALDFALAVAAPARVDLKPALLAAYRELDAFAEVPGALTRLREGGARLAILSNGSPRMLADAARSAGIDTLLDHVVSVDEIAVYKTDPRVYALAVERLGVAAGEISFQSSNRWDVAGAAAFGLRAVWINRAGQPDEYGDLAPAAVMSSLDGLLA
jgi:2-haloacid dehalogenase